LAGEIGANLLTHLLGQNLEELAEKISIYRKALRDYGHGPGHVTLMVHTFIGDDLDEVRATVKQPFCSYLRSSFGLIQNLARSLGKNIDSDKLSEEDMDTLLSHAFDRYFQTSGLMGTLEAGLEMVERMRSIGVDEVSCLVDFGVDTDKVLNHLRYLEVLKRHANDTARTTDENLTLSAEIERHAITHLQCTPSMARMLAYEPGSFSALRNLNALLVGGEALPLPLAQEIGAALSGGDIRNMYGPTETTIWSTTDVVERLPERITIGRPIGNTEVYILNRELEPAPLGVAGVLHIGGDGVSRGYINSPDLTAASFIPDLYGRPGTRLYVTGDVTHYLGDGKIEFLGREDQQVKLRGYRIEPAEIEAALDRHPSVLQSAVLMQADEQTADRLVAYVVDAPERSLTISEMKEFLKGQLPDYMIPSLLVRLDFMPLTPNGKIDRKSLPGAGQPIAEVGGSLAMPRTPLEEALVSIWAEILGLEDVGIHSDFFQIGGHSILASQLVARIRDLFHVELKLRTFFGASTVAQLAEAMITDPEEKSRVEGIAELLISVADCSNDEIEAMLSNGHLA
jgi:acyl carrier protein